jgi:WD40 repeat protein
MTLKVWDVETGRELRTLRGHTGLVTGVALSVDGQSAISASSDQTLKLWDVETGHELRTFRGHSDLVHGVALRRDGRRAVSVSGDMTLKLWDVETGEAIATFTCDAPASCCAFITDDRVIAGDAGGHLHFLHLEEPKT